MAKRIGVFGGTFDPIHNAHLSIARAAMDQAGLDKVLFVVAARPPHKRAGVQAPAGARLRLLEAAVAEERGMEASSIEIDRDGPSYTADTLQQLRSEFPDAAFFLIIGMDSLRDLPNWRQPGDILARAQILVVSRPGQPRPPESEIKYQMLDFPAMEVSSTDIRARLARGESISGLVPDAVARIIYEEGLYDARIQHPARG